MILAVALFLPPTDDHNTYLQLTTQLTVPNKANYSMIPGGKSNWFTIISDLCCLGKVPFMTTLPGEHSFLSSSHFTIKLNKLEVTKWVMNGPML